MQSVVCSLIRSAFGRAIKDHEGDASIEATGSRASVSTMNSETMVMQIWYVQVFLVIFSVC